MLVVVGGNVGFIFWVAGVGFIAKRAVKGC